MSALVERIIAVESNGDPNAKNSRSSAMGLGQFLDETWLDLVRAYRPDLARGRSERETLDLRREPKLAREITMRFVERNIAMLRQRGLPVTAGTLYLAHFAGGAGAVAILSAPDNSDAALVIASADLTGRTKRERLIKANPFLEHFTVADLKVWADRKMRAPNLRLTEVLAADARPLNQRVPITGRFTTSSYCGCRSLMKHDGFSGSEQDAHIQPVRCPFGMRREQALDVQATERLFAALPDLPVSCYLRFGAEPLSHSANFDHRRRPETLRTAMATAFFCPTSRTNRFPLVTPV